MADDLGYGDLGVYGQQLIKTPNIDLLATDGMLFTRHYSGSTICAPARSVLMTGLHTGHTHVRGNGGGDEGLPDDVVTIAEVARAAGYTTALIGKWGLGMENQPGEPSNQGFDYYYGYLDQIYAHNYFPEFLMRNGEREYLDNTVEYLDSTHWSKGRGSTSSVKNTFSHDLLTADALDYIERHADTSFFLYLPYTIPHDNGEEDRDQRYEIPTYGDYTDRDWTEPEKGYAAMITRLDRDVGLLRRHLDSLGIADNTVIIFTSDNGPTNPELIERFDSNGKLRGHKRDLYEGGIRVPLIVTWPGHVAPGTKSDHISAFQDWMPTLAEIGALDKQLPPTDGLSLLPTLTGEGTQAEHDYLYWEFDEKGGKLAALKGDWKAVRNDFWEKPDAPLELYDLSTDPSETTDVAAEHPDIVAEMERILEEAHEPSALFPFPTEAR
jgi:arylsulfatase A-like enzyme